MKGHRGNPGLKGGLVNKSIEGYILALETINRLSIHYRVETFCVTVHRVNRNVREEWVSVSEEGIRKNPTTEKEWGAH